MKLYPFTLPDNIHPYAWVLLGFGLPGEMLDKLARHLFDDLGVSMPSLEPVTHDFSWSVGIEQDGYERVEVGDFVNIPIEGGAVRVTEGAFPPGVRLDKTRKRINGTFTHGGLYSATVTVLPAVKYDPLGSPGGPEDPGVWIPVDQPRKQVDVGLNAFPSTVDDLSVEEKDRLLAALMAERDGRTIKGADNGN